MSMGWTLAEDCGKGRQGERWWFRKNGVENQSLLYWNDSEMLYNVVVNIEEGKCSYWTMGCMMLIADSKRRSRPRQTGKQRRSKFDKEC